MAGPGFGAPGLSFRDTVKKMVRENHGQDREDIYFAAVAGKLELKREGIKVKKAMDRIASRLVRSLMR